MTLEEAFKTGYAAGWDESGEGHNAEWSNMSTAVWRARRDAAWERYKEEPKLDEHRM